MNLSPSSFCTVDDILSDVLGVVDDSDLKLRSKGWYISQIQQSLEELSFDTFFNEVNKVIDIPQDLRIEMPQGAFNIQQMYLFNGDDCNIAGKVNVYHKRNFINSNSGNGYVARDSWDNNRDPFYASRSIRGRSSHNEPGRNQLDTIPSNVYFYGTQNGMIMLSENCRNHTKMMLVYNGVSCDIGDIPIVPLFFRQAVKDWVSVKALQLKKQGSIGTNAYNHWANEYAITKNDLTDPYEGSWIKAERRASRIDSKEREDLKEYMARFNY